MKLKRTIAAVAAAVTAFTMGAASLTACAPECEHQYKWTVRKEATCVEEGLQVGVCGLCSDVKEEVIPVSEEHKYGEWQITAPTQESTGKAVKVCSLSNGHTLEVTLPAITEAGTGYDSYEITTPSTTTKPGVRTFVLNHAQGNIVFTASVPTKPIESVSDAVELGASNGNLIRSATGRINTDTKRFQYYNFMYEYGENYTHYKSQGGIGGSTELEIWASVDENGDIYAVRTDIGGKPAQDTSATKDYMNGYPFTIAYAFSQAYYGAEQLLSGLYEWALENHNKDFSEQLKTSNGVTEYTFRFSVYSVRYLNDINVSFTLGDTGAIDSLRVVTNNYDSGAWELDPETEVGSITASSPSGIEVIEIQTVLKSSDEGQTVPENPYPKTAFQIKSFDLRYGSTVIDDETVIEVNADSLAKFSIANVRDNSAGVNDLAYDPLTFWLRTEEGDKPISSVVAGSNENLYVLQSSETNGSPIINLRSRITGKLTIAIKTRSGGFTKLLNVDVKTIAPALGQLSTSVYEYGDRAYIWNNVGETTVYAGQELLFKAGVSEELQSYVDATVTLPTVRTRPEGVEDSDFSITETETQQIFKFVTQKPGSYTLRLVSARNAQRYCNLIINVLAVPDIGELLTGEYSGNIQYPQRGTVQVRFSPESATAGKAIITFADLGTQTLSYVWDGQKLTTEHVSGREDFGFSLSINEAYKLVLSHPTGVGEGAIESVVVNKPNA